MRLVWGLKEADRSKDEIIIDFILSQLMNGYSLNSSTISKADYPV
jgi:hypothetical protein